MAPSWPSRPGEAASGPGPLARLRDVAGSGSVRPERAPWNHNIHYHPLILGAVPAGCQRGLDVGCGEGVLARELRQVVPHVVGIDIDGPVIGRARQQDNGAGVADINRDLLTYDLPPESIDVIV